MAGPAYKLSHRWWYAAIAVLVVIASYAIQNIIAPYGMDFVSYWSAAKLTLAGDAAGAYDQALHRAVSASAADFAGQMPFPYPPPYLILVAPFGLIDFPIAAALWIALSVGMWWAVVRKVFPGHEALALAFPPVLVCGMIGQNGLLSASLLLLGMHWLPTRRFVAGVMFGCLAMKPQLACLIPLALLAAREWRALAGSVAGFAGLALLSLAVFGIGAWQGFFDMLPLYGSLAREGLVGWQRIASVYAMMRQIGLDPGPAVLVHALVATGAMLIVWTVWRHSADTILRGAALVTATMLISPYLYLYDHAMLIAAIIWALREGVSQRAIAALFGLSFLGFIQMAVAAPIANVMPVVPVMLLGMIAWRLRGGPATISRDPALPPARTRHSDPAPRSPA